MKAAKVSTALVLALFVLGCGARDWASASGSVTLDGQPLKKGLIMFHVTDGGADAAVGVGQIADGTFTIHTGKRPGLKPGQYIVTISETSAPPPDSGEAAKLLTPDKYAREKTTDLKAEVKPGSNSFEFKMASK